MSGMASATSDGKVIYSTQVTTAAAASARGRPTNPVSSMPASSSAAAGARPATAASSSVALSQAAMVPSKPAVPAQSTVTKTFVTKTSPQKPAVSTTTTTTTQSALKPMSAQSTRVMAPSAIARPPASRESVALSEVPFSAGNQRYSSAAGVPVSALRSRSLSPKRKYTPRRGRGSVTTDARAPQVRQDTSFPKEYWTYSAPKYTSAPAPASASTAPAIKSAPAPVTFQSPLSKRAVSADSTSPARVRVKSIECRAVFMHQGRSWKFSLPPEASVNDAISEATQQVLRNVVETDHRLGEKLSISVLPCVTDTSTVSEWSHRNLDQPPLIVIKSEQDELAQQKPEFDAQNMQRLMEEQTRLLVALQKQLGEQTAIIRNQATFISELQERDRERASTLGEAVARIEEEMASMKGQLLTIEEHMTKAGNENTGKKAKA